MYSDWLQWILPLGVLTWLGVLTYLVWRQWHFLKSLFPSSGERDIRKKFEEILKLEGNLNDLALKSLGNIQKVGLVRFNPYEDTGGDISFSLALLNAKGDGIVLTSLHSRSGTRIFAKPVVNGKAEKYQFSKEEEDVVREALGN